MVVNTAPGTANVVYAPLSSRNARVVATARQKSTICPGVHASVGGVCAHAVAARPSASEAATAPTAMATVARRRTRGWSIKAILSSSTRASQHVSRHQPIWALRISGRRRPSDRRWVLDWPHRSDLQDGRTRSTATAHRQPVDGCRGRALTGPTHPRSRVIGQSIAVAVMPAWTTVGSHMRPAVTARVSSGSTRRTNRFMVTLPSGGKSGRVW